MNAVKFVSRSQTDLKLATVTRDISLEMTAKLVKVIAKTKGIWAYRICTLYGDLLGTVKSLLSSREAYLISGPKRGRLIREGGLTERGGGSISNHTFSTKFTIIVLTLLLYK